MLQLSLALLAAAGVVQGQINNYGTLAFIRTGERTPWVRSGTETLTALGAQQMLELGQNFRGRYIDEATGATRLGVRPIAGMAPHRLDPDQLFIQTLDQPFLVAAAQAFTQGLYPQYGLNDTRNGPYPDAVGVLANRSVVDYPLDGYQYANIMTVGSGDPGSIYLDGHAQCLSAWVESANYEGTVDFVSTRLAENAFYKSLSMSWFKDDLPDEAMLDYRNAYGIYDSLAYHYTHDMNTLADLSDEENAGVFDKVRLLANQDAWYRYGNVSLDTDSTSANRAMAGKTLAGLILDRFERIVENEGNTTNGISQPLNLLFGEYTTMMSLLSILDADYYQSQGSIRQEIPDFASAIIFELFTQGNDTADNPDNLWVRFSYHNGTQAYQDTAPQTYSIFRNGPSRNVITWQEFSDSMSRIAVRQSSDWCSTCSSQSVFCPIIDTTTSITTSDKSKSKLSPVVAGVIGAVVTLAVAALLFGLAMLLGGIRLHRVSRRSSSLGGFKGSAKLASDPDLGLAKQGAAPAGNDPFADPAGGNKRAVHERVGSWELRAKERSGEESPRGSFEAIEAAMGRPIKAVQPLERI